MSAFDTTALRAELRSYEHADPIVRAWYRGLAAYLNDRMLAVDFESALALYAHDVERGGFTYRTIAPELIGVPPVLVAALEGQTFEMLASLAPEGSDLRSALEALAAAWE